MHVKNLDNIESTIYRIAENQLDLDNLNISESAYKIIEDSQNNFNLVKYGNKFPIKYDSENIIYIDYSISFIDKQQLQNSTALYTIVNIYHCFNICLVYYIITCFCFMHTIIDALPCRYYITFLPILSPSS